MPHLAVVFTNFGPYHIARLQALSVYCQELGWQFTGIELARAEADYDWKTDLDSLTFNTISILQDQALETVSFLKLGFRLWQTLHKLQPDAISIAGYFRPSMLTALLWCNQHNRPAILMSATTEQDFTRSPIRERIKQAIMNNFSAALVGGKPHARYLRKLGMADEAIFFGYNVVENKRFSPNIIGSSASPHTHPYFLSVCRFIPKKNLTFLIAAYDHYRRIYGTSAWDLILCGDGPLRDSIDKQIQTLNLGEHVHLPGFLQQEQLLPYLAHAHCLIHASVQEQWGLVINEAMAAGLPVIVSDRCGCYEDLVQDGITGFGFDPEKIEQLTQLMVKFSTGDIDRKQIGKNALEHIKNYSPEHFANNLIAAAKYALHPINIDSN